MRYFIEFAYNGGHYFGYQRQLGQISVQQVLEEKLSVLLKEDIATTGAGRTDTGVNAKQMFAHFDFQGEVPFNLIQKLNSFLPKDIVVFNIFKVKEDAHARFDAISRAYKYYIDMQKNPFSGGFSYYFPFNLNVEMMNLACEILFKYNDFQCFSKSNTDVKTYLCTINKAVWHQDDNRLVFEISANRFLRNMVRAIVGTMLEIGREKISLNDFSSIIESKDRSKAGFSVPGNALFLTEVKYPDDIFI